MESIFIQHCEKSMHIYDIATLNFGFDLLRTYVNGRELCYEHSKENIFVFLAKALSLSCQRKENQRAFPV